MSSKVGFLLSSLMMTSQPHSTPLARKVDAIVVGAGISGLAAARRLAQEGLSVKVLEAGDRAGGRMLTVQAPGGQVELGAQFFHGTEGNPVYALALKHGLMDDAKQRLQQQVHAFNSMRVVVEGGVEADAKAVAEGNAAFEEAWEELQSGSAFTAGTPGDESAGAYVRRRFGELTRSSKLSPDLLARSLNSQMRMQASIDGGETHLLHLRQPSTYHDLEGPRALPAPRAGYSQLVSTLMAELPADSILFNSPVSAISCTPETHGGLACVRFTNGGEEQALSAPLVILAVSLGVLQAGSLSFYPPLPPSKTEAIARMRMGQVEKIFFEFSEEDWVQLDVLRLSNITLYPRQGASDSIGLLKSIHGLYRIPNTRYMCCWVTGELACHQMHQASDEALITCLSGEILSIYVPPEVSAKVPRARGVVRSTWTSSPLFCGSYSYMHKQSSAQDIAELGMPVRFPPHPTPESKSGEAQPTNSLLFAGEATHPNYYGTVHGAFMAGEREARRGMDILRHAQTPSANTETL